MVNGERVSVGGEEPSQAALGRAMNLSPAAMTKLKKQGMPVHSLEAALAWRSARQNIAQRKPMPKGMTEAPAPRPAASGGAPPRKPDGAAIGETHDEARTRREIADADLAELKLRELRSELVRAADVRMTYAKRVAALREALLQIPARLATVLAAEPDQAKCHVALEHELHQVLSQLVNEQ